MGAKNMTREARDMELQWFDIRELTEDAAQTVIGMMDETRRRRVADIAGEDDRKRTIAGELHKRHSTVLDAISRAAAVCPQRDAFVRGNYVDAKGQRCPQYMVSREGIIFLSQSYAARQTDAWRNILDTLSSVPEVVTRRPVPQRLPGLPATERLFTDIEKALFALDGTENWTHITVRRELSGIGSVPFEVEKAIKHHINAAWYSLGLAQSSLQAALALRKLA